MKTSAGQLYVFAITPPTIRALDANFVVPQA